MKRSIHTFSLFDEEELYGPPIPEITAELAKYQPHNSPEEVAYMVLQRVRKRIDRLKKFIESDTYDAMNLTQQKIIKYQLSAMDEYEYYLRLRYNQERKNPNFNNPSNE